MTKKPRNFLGDPGPYVRDESYQYDNEDLEIAKNLYAIFEECVRRVGPDNAKGRLIAGIQCAIRDARGK